MRERTSVGLTGWQGVLGRGRALLALWLLATPAAAGTISISVTPVAEIRDGVLTVDLTVKNGGDEAAHSVTPALYFRDQVKRGPSQPSLGPNQTMETTLAVPAGDVGQGRWPYRLTVDYADANQYPFQALHVLGLAVGAPPPAKVAVTHVEKTTLSKTGTISVAVKNLTGTERSAEVEFLVPEGLEVTREISPVALVGWEERKVSAPVANRTALAGSTLPVFVTIQYDDGDTHQTVVSQGVVEIVPVRSFLVEQRFLLGIGALLLVMAWGAYVARQLGRRRASGGPS